MKSQLVATVIALASALVGIEADCQTVAALQRLSTTRNFVIGPFCSGCAPLTFKVRAVDAMGNPVMGAIIMIGTPGWHPSNPIVKDEFGFKGFNFSREGMTYCAEGLGVDQYLGTTGVDGIASVTPPLNLVVPGAGLNVVARWMRDVNCDGYEPPVQAYFPTVFLASQPSGTPSVVVEYFNAPLDHYFITLLPDEIDKLDAGVFSGWAQSIGAFAAYTTKADAPADAVPVCRFWSPVYSSHFYTADPAECDTVLQKWPDVWTLETREAFYIFVPDTVTGTCAPGQQAIYRMYNNLPIPNHRYITDRALRNWMTGAGWRAEGYGPESVMMCAPT